MLPSAPVNGNYPTSGSILTRPRRNTKNSTREENAYKRAVSKLKSEDNVKAIQNTWNNLKHQYGEREWEQGEGIIITLIQQGLSEREIRSFLPVGGSKLQRLRKALQSGFEDFHTRKKKPIPSHALSEEDLAFIKADVETWELEDGFPCSHRRPRQYLVEQGIKWINLWERYETKRKAISPDLRIVSYERWLQYIHYFFPGLRLTRSKVDVCDACIRIEFELMKEDLDPEERINLEEKKNASFSCSGTKEDYVTFYKKICGIVGQLSKSIE